MGVQVQRHKAAATALIMLLLGASPAHKFERPGNQQQTRTDSMPKRPLAAQKPADIIKVPAALAAAEKRPCVPGHDDRRSELCAQWKAADQAVRAADLAWWQVVFGAISSLGLLAALALTLRSNHIARRALEVAQNTSLLQLRPYFGSREWKVHVEPQRAEPWISIRFTCANFGQTPALDARVRLLVAFAETHETARASWQELEEAGPQIVHPSDAIDVTSRFDFEANSPVWSELQSALKKVFVRLQMKYCDSFGGTHSDAIEMVMEKGGVLRALPAANATT